MIALGLIVVVVMAVALGARRWRSGGSRVEDVGIDSDTLASDTDSARAATKPLAREPEGDRRVDQLLDRWVGASLISVEESAAIHRFEGERARAAVTVTPPVVSRRIPAIAEALGYLGGVLAIVGLALLVARYWPMMATGWKLMLSGGVAAALGLIGGAVPESKDAAFARLRGFVWLASMAASGLFAGVAVHDGWGITRAQSITLSVSAVVAVVGAAMWQLRDRFLQQLTTLVALVVVAATATGEFASSGFVGIVVAALGAGLIASAWWRHMSLSRLNVAVGSAAILLAGLIMRSDWMAGGLIFSMITSLVMLAGVVAPSAHLERSRQLIIGVVGLIALVMGVPQSIGFFAEQAGVTTGLVVWVAGVIFMTLATRRQVRFTGMVEVASGVALVGGAAICAVQSRGFASIFGLLTALALLALGTRPGQVVLSFLGSVGLLVFVPWSIVHFFPGPGRAPLLILISGALILSLALVLSHERDRIPHEFFVLFGRHWSGRHGRMSH